MNQQKIAAPKNSFTACQKEKKKSLWNDRFYWCRKAFDDTFEEQKENIKKINCRFK